MKRLALVVFGGALFAFAEAHACTNLNFTLQPGSFDLTGNASPTLVARVTANTTSAGCTFFLTFDYGASSSYSTRALRRSGGFQWPFQIHQASTLDVLKTLADAVSNSDILVGSFSQSPGTQQLNLSYRVFLDQANLYRRFGNYDDDVTVSLYRGTLSSSTFVRTRNLSLEYSAPKKIDLSIVDPSSAFNLSDTTQLMDFGSSMQAGDVANADLLVKYNAGYRIRLSSLRDGVLRRTTAPFNTIGYTFRFNGNVISLAGSSGSPTTVETGSGVSPVDGLRRTLQATVGSIAGKAPGLYEDVITITVQSTE